MANHHTTRFVSVNLNKSYGHPQPQPQSSRSSSTYHNNHAANGGTRSRPSAGGRGMVVLSRPGQKSAPKLSVPAPLNLPSLRREHERFDPTAPGSASGPAGNALGSGHAPPAMGWSKPTSADGPKDRHPAAESPVGSPAHAASSSGAPDRAVFLKGEDFPSLKATLLSGQKVPPRQRLEESPRPPTQRPSSEPSLAMRPHGTRASDSKRRSNEEPPARGGEKPQKQDGLLSGPLPLIHFKPSSEWADDERDTSHGILDRGTRTSRDLDFGEKDYGRDLPMKNGSSWRSSPLHSRQGHGGGREAVGVDRDYGFRGSDHNRDSVAKESNGKFGYSIYADSMGSVDQQNNRRGFGHGQGLQTGRDAGVYNGRRLEKNDNGWHFDGSGDRLKGDSLQRRAPSKLLSNRGDFLDDPILNLSRESRRNGKSSLDDAAFDDRDPFSGGLSGDANSKLFRRKKDAHKLVDFYDPVRESFEAELERVQKLQEEERQRAIKEHTRALEMARREEEERERLFKEEEDRRRRLEEEVREAAWIAEQERLNAAKRAEEQRLAREEEKRKLLMEDERRKEAAHQKLLELEAKIARRQAEEAAKENQLPVSPNNGRVAAWKERNSQNVSDAEYWEDGERVVECVTVSMPSEPTVVNRFTSPDPTLPIAMEGDFHSMERGNMGKPLRSEPSDVGNKSSVFLEQQCESRIVKEEAFNSPRILTRKGLSSGQGASHLRPSSKGGSPDVARAVGDCNPPKGHRWNVSRGSEGHSPNTFVDSNVLEGDNYEVGWDHNSRGGSPHVIYTENMFSGAEIEGISNTGRARQYLRQPRVFPPPTFTSGRRGFVRDDPKHPNPNYFENERSYHAADKSEDIQSNGSEDHELNKQPNISSSRKAPLMEPNDENASGCSSLSSALVSNPPISPTHLSHDDDLDDSAGFPSLPASADGRPIAFSEGEHAVEEVSNTNSLLASRSTPSRDEEEWLSGNNSELQEQDGYDEDDYHEEGERCERNVSILDISDSFVLPPDTHHMDADREQDQKVLGFNNGIEVLIPNDDFETSSTNVVNNIKAEIVPTDAAPALHSSDGPIIDENDLHLESSTCEENVGTSELINVAEHALHDLALDPATSTTDEVKNSEMSSSAAAASVHSASSVDSSRPCSSPGQPTPSRTPNVLSQSDAAVQLQFGLFSGPSLIPSPVPAIQIGSIQMPLNIQSPIGPHVHSSQPPFLQFGQLRYTSPISQGIMPIGSQSVPYAQPSLPVHYSVMQNPESSVSNHAALASFPTDVQKDNSASSSFPTDVQKDNSASSVSSTFKSSHGENTFDESSIKQELNQGNALHVDECNVLPSHDNAECSSNKENSFTTELDTSAKIQESCEDVPKNDSTSVYNKNEKQAASQAVNKSHYFPRERHVPRMRVAGPISAGRGKRYIYAVKNRGPQPQLSVPDIPRVDFNNDRRAPRGLRRTEFRVRKTDYRRYDASDAVDTFRRKTEKSYSYENANVPSLRSGSKRGFFISRSPKIAVESESSNVGSRSLQSAHHDRRKNVKESPIKMPLSSSHSRHGEGSIKTNGHVEEDIDAPLQSGVVRIYKQPGIETPSDEDDFIEVRSKRQMLNDRREQREKENKAKSRDAKIPRKPRSISRTNTFSSKPNNKVMRGGISRGIPTSFSLESADLSGGGKSTAVPMTSACQPLAPIGTPTPTTNVDSDRRSLNKKSFEMSSDPVAPSGAPTELVPHSIFEKVAPFENVAASLGSWTDVHINQQVMTLTQTQLEEAMKPECFDACGSLVVDHDSMMKGHTKASKSMVTQDKSFSTSGSPLSSLLAGERIQFGAVTTPSFLPSVTQGITNGMSPLPSSTCKSESSHEHTSTSETAHGIFFEKEKHGGKSCIHLEDSEAEAAASAVAVAAISSDEVVSSGLDTTPVSISDHGKFASVDGCGLTSQGSRGNGQVTTLSTGEESLPVTLPADLSVENPLPPWSALPAQSTSSTTFSQLPGLPPSHFPCFEMNPMLRGPMFTFGPQEESSSTQSQPQPQRSTTLSPGQLGTWSHSGMDSFYGPPAGFAGHFVGPPAGMPGVQAPPQMVFYNHFPTLAPFGVGIMGTTFISSGKQPDWKHTPVSSAMDVNEGDIEKMPGCSTQHISPSMPSSLQHLSPASPLVPVASPLPMFDISSFQSTVDAPVQARWSHLQPPLHSVSFPPLQRHQVENGIAVDINQRLATSSSVGHKFPKSRHTTEAEDRFSFSSDPAAQFPDELGLVDPPTSVVGHVPSSGFSSGPLSGKNSDDKGPKENQHFARGPGGSSSMVSTSAGGNSGGGNNSTRGTTASTSKPQITPQASTSTPQQHHPVGCADKRHASSSHRASGGEWHRRAGSQVRNHASSGSERNFPASKMKQIYVAKSPANRTTAA